MLNKFNKIEESLINKLEGPSSEEVERNLRLRYKNGTLSISGYYKKAKELNIIGPTNEEIKNEYDKDNNKFIKNAIIDGIYGFVKYGIDNGYNLNNIYNNELLIAVLYERKLILKLLLENGINYDIYTFKIAYDKNNNEIIEILEKHFNMTYNKFCNENIQEYLYLSIRKNNLDGVKDAIEKGANVNEKLDINLQFSIINNFEKIAFCLIFHGGKIDHKIIELINNSKCYKLKEIIKYY